MRRGPFAVPTETEKIEYLLGRVPKSYRRSPFEQFPLEHVLSYQRRITAIKKHFMARGKMSPLGVVYDFWDRTEVAEHGDTPTSHEHELVAYVSRRLLPQPRHSKEGRCMRTFW